MATLIHISRSFSLVVCRGKAAPIDSAGVYSVRTNRVYIASIIGEAVFWISGNVECEKRYVFVRKPLSISSCSLPRRNLQRNRLHHEDEWYVSQQSNQHPYSKGSRTRRPVKFRSVTREVALEARGGPQAPTLLALLSAAFEKTSQSKKSRAAA